MLDFLQISFIDILDIICVGLLIYGAVKLIRGTSAVSIFYSILILYVVCFFVNALHMELLAAIMGQVLGVGVIALIVLFQPEIRRFLLKMGTRSNVALRGAFLARLFRPAKSEGIDSKALEELTAACRKMSETYTGALIVLRHGQNLDSIIETGDSIEALVNRRLIENIFFKNTPLHDGAMIMSDHSILAARCTLPITDSQDIHPRYGMRHRAAVGVTEVTDASAIVVSEETGEITYVYGGQMKTMNSITELRLAIQNSYNS